MVAISVEALRREFDEPFALPVRQATAGLVDLLAIRVGDGSYTLRIAEISALVVGRSVTPIPSSVDALMGLIGLRGELVAVFDLAKMLGEAPRQATPRWVAVCGVQRQLAFAFHELEGHLRVPPTALREAPDERQSYIDQVLESGDSLRRVLSVPKLVGLAVEGTGREQPGKGR